MKVIQSGSTAQAQRKEELARRGKGRGCAIAMNSLKKDPQKLGKALGLPTCKIKPFVFDSVEKIQMLQSHNGMLGSGVNNLSRSVNTILDNLSVRTRFLI